MMDIYEENKLMREELDRIAIGQFGHATMRAALLMRAIGPTSPAPSQSTATEGWMNGFSAERSEKMPHIVKVRMWGNESQFYENELAYLFSLIKPFVPSQTAEPLARNPYTGENRDYRDVQSDPTGLLIVKPGEPLKAASQTASVESIDDAEFRKLADAYHCTTQDELESDYDAMVCHIDAHTQQAVADALEGQARLSGDLVDGLLQDVVDLKQRTEKAEADLKQVNEWRTAALADNKHTGEMWSAKVKELEAALAQVAGGQVPVALRKLLEGIVKTHNDHGTVLIVDLVEIERILATPQPAPVAGAVAEALRQTLEQMEFWAPKMNGRVFGRVEEVANLARAALTQPAGDTSKGAAPDETK